MKRIQGSKDLIFDALEETTHLVQRMHNLAAQKSVKPLMFFQPLAMMSQAVKATHDFTASGIYESIRIVNRGINNLLDVGVGLLAPEGKEEAVDSLIEPATPLRSDAQGSRSWVIDHIEASLNGLYGDFLKNKQNDLDLGMTFRHHGNILPLERDAIAQAYPDATGKICVFVHGLSCTEWSWCISADEFYGDPTVNFGSMLNQEFNYTPLYVRYNTGRHISENGKMLAEILTQLTAAYPKDIEEIMLVGHSMGGLVARSAAYYGSKHNAPWVKRLRHLFCLGSPHLGAPLEKAVNVLSNLLRLFNTPGTQAPAEFLDSRSAGIKDLRFGYTVDEEWNGKDPDAFLKNDRQDPEMVDSVGYYYIASIITHDPNDPMSFMFGDLLVRLPSAAGHTADPTRRIPFHSGYCLNGLCHLHLSNHPEVYKAIRQCLALLPEHIVQTTG